VPGEKLHALDQLVQHLNFDSQPLRKVLQLKSGELQRSSGSMASLFREYLASIEQVVWAVDRQLHPSP
jgi:hypothetical protein